MFFDDEIYQEPISDTPFHAVYRCYSAAFLTDRERTNVENGEKILLPQSALEQLVDQTDIMMFKLTNPQSDRQTHCGVLEFLPDDQPNCYLPHWMMAYLLLDEGSEIQIESIQSLPSATFVRFQPQTKMFLDITNPKAVLEKVLRNFSCLTKGDLISINYLNRNYELAVLELKPANVVSIIECDLEVDFAPPADYIEPKKFVNEEELNRQLRAFISPPGERHRLPEKEEKGNIDSGEVRGKPNYNYKYGLLQFPRQPFRCLNEERNEISEKNSSNLFQPFTGEGKALRQPQNQRPK